MTLAAAHAHVVDALTGLGVPVVPGPPFTLPPAPPCYTVAAPDVALVEATAGVACGHVVTATVQVLCVPATTTDLPGMLDLADTAVAALGAAVTDGTTEPSPFTDDPDTLVYRLTVEV